MQLTLNQRDLQSDFLEELFLQTQAHLGYFFEQFDLAELRRVVKRLLASEGKIILTGVGKSGIIAKKVAMTMNSYGCKALYISPMNALHGDLGLVSEGDVALLFSKSGESDELLNLCPALRNKNVTIVACVSTRDSRLMKAADDAVVLPVAKELCPFDLAPTTSTVVQLLFGDLVTVALMRAKNVSIDTFVGNHPAGRVGKRMTLRVKDLMLWGEALPCARAHDRLVDVLVELSNKTCGCTLIVAETTHLEGIFTDGDLRRALQMYGAAALEKCVAELMTIAPRTSSPELLAYDAMKCMEQNQKGAITALPVVEDGVVVGLIRLHDIIQSGL